MPLVPPLGIVGLSFGKHAVEPNPINQKLAEDLDRQAKHMVFVDGHFAGEKPVVIAQWEIAKASTYDDMTVVDQRDATNVDRGGKSYLDSQDVLNVAFAEWRAKRVTDVIVIAHPFLHKPAVEKMVRQAGFNVIKHRVPFPGFDNSPDALQWWCKGPIRFVAYLVIQVVGKVLNKNLHGIGEKPTPSPSRPYI